MGSGNLTSPKSLLSIKLPEKHPAQTELGIIGEEIDRVSHIVRQLNDFAHPRPAAREPFDVNLLIANMLQLLKDPRLRPADIEAQFEPDNNIPILISVKNSLKQVVINLIKNAVEAMTAGGRLHVATKFIPAFGGEPSASENPPPLPAVELSAALTSPARKIARRAPKPCLSPRSQRLPLATTVNFFQLLTLAGSTRKAGEMHYPRLLFTRANGLYTGGKIHGWRGQGYIHIKERQDPENI